MKKYIELQPNGSATHLKIEVYYNKGGYNVFTHKDEQRGYYLSVSPVSRENRGGYTLESYAAFSGVKLLIRPVSRKSEKAGLLAETEAATREPDLIRYVCEKNGLSLAQ